MRSLFSPPAPYPGPEERAVFVSAGMVLRSGRIVDCPQMLGLRGKNERNNRTYVRSPPPTSHLSPPIFCCLFFDFDFFFSFLSSAFAASVFTFTTHPAIYKGGEVRRIIK